MSTCGVSGGGPVCGAWPIPIRIKLFIVLCDLMSFQRAFEKNFVTNRKEKKRRKKCDFRIVFRMTKPLSLSRLVPSISRRRLLFCSYVLLKSREFSVSINRVELARLDSPKHALASRERDELENATRGELEKRFSGSIVDDENVVHV